MNTHESYVNLEIAKLLKEAGFDWVCREYYYNFTTTGWSLSFDDNFVNWNNWSEQYVSAPTLDVAQRWLREVKGIEVNVLCVYIEHIKKYSYTVFIKEYEREIIDEGFDTYEEAQEAGIKKALEMILKKGE